MKITISGKGGSGKTSAAKLLAKKLGYKFYSIGDLRGKMAMERKMTIDELNEIGKKEDWTDKEADKLTEKVGKEEDNFVVDGRLAYHFIPDSVKIFMTVDPQVGAERVFKNQREDEEKKETIEELQNMLEERMESNKERYQKWYGIDFLDKDNYDFILDTTHRTMEEVVDNIIEFLKKKGLQL